MFTDPAAGMVEAARTEAAKRGLTNIQFTQCSADALPFPDNTFDVALGRLSAMFFPDPAAGVAEALRVLVENGRVSFVVWGQEEVNPFFSVLTAVTDQFVESPEDPDEPDPFRFATPGSLAQILTAAKAKNVTERLLSFQVTAPISFEQFWNMRTEMSEKLREKVAKLTPAQLREVKATAANSAQEYFAGGTMNFPAEALIVGGRKSGS
jgi:ubiquinone/menaquinone biosynthesis C-methylase UbiE